LDSGLFWHTAQMKQTLFTSLALGLLSLSSLFAAPASAVERNFAWADLGVYVRHCSIQPFWVAPSGQKVYGNLKSVCAELQTSPRVAKFPFQGVNYTAVLADSRDADEGDLNDLQLFDDHGHLIDHVDGVLAFGDILLALASGHQNIPEVYDPGQAQAE